MSIHVYTEKNAKRRYRIGFELSMGAKFRGLRMKMSSANRSFKTLQTKFLPFRDISHLALLHSGHPMPQTISRITYDDEASFISLSSLPRPCTLECSSRV